MTQSEKQWQIGCNKSRFERWRKDPSFLAVVTLARIVNAMRFAGTSLKHTVNDESPSSIRQRINSFMYTGALLYEAAKYVQKVKKQLGGYTAYRERLKPLFETTEAKDLLEKQLSKLRNRGVFHFDHTFIPVRVAADPDGWCVFARGVGDTTGESYYDLADRSTLDGVVGGQPTEFRVRYQELDRRTTELMKSFLDAADETINEALSPDDWQMKIT